MLYQLPALTTVMGMNFKPLGQDGVDVEVYNLLDGMPEHPGRGGIKVQILSWGVLMTMNYKMITGIAILLSSSYLFSDADIKFQQNYKLLLPVDGNKIEIGSLYRYDIKIDEKYKVQSNYRSRLSIKLDCGKVHTYSNNSFIHEHLKSICDSSDRDNKSNLIAYDFDSYLEGIRNSNMHTYKALNPDSFDSLITNNFDAYKSFIGTYPPDKGKGWFFHTPIPDQYTTVFMSRHHELRLLAIVNNKSVEPGLPCDKPVHKPSFPSHHLFCVTSSHGEQWCNNINAHKTRYSCLIPGLDHFPPDFDDAVNSLEPLFLGYFKGFLLNLKLHLNHYATILPFYRVANGKSYPPPAFIYHRKISYEFSNCYAEESAKDDPLYNSSNTRIEYCRSWSGSTWEKITLFENKKPVLIFLGVDGSWGIFNWW